MFLLTRPTVTKRQSRSRSRSWRSGVGLGLEGLGLGLGLGLVNIPVKMHTGLSACILLHGVASTFLVLNGIKWCSPRRCLSPNLYASI
jgi:hypothetical protein